MKKTDALFIGILAILLCVACSSEKKPSTETLTTTAAVSLAGGGTPVPKSSKDTLVVGNSGDIMNLNPFTSNSNYSLNVLSQIFETLVQKDVSTGEYTGLLAERWEYVDDCTIMFYLRKGVLFHNGDEMKASDVIYSMNIWKETAVMSTLTAHIDMEKTEAVDDYTVKLVTTEPYIPQLYMLEYPSCVIISEKVMEASGKEITQESSIGTGPYMLKKWITGDSVELEGFDDYWEEGVPYVKHLTIRAISDDTMRTIELETGAIDLSLVVDVNDLNRLEADPNITVYKKSGMNTRYVLFNCAGEYFSDELLRQAVAYGIDIDAAVETAWGSKEYAAQGYFTPSVPGFKSGLIRTRDVEKAKALMAEAGYPDGFTCRLVCMTTKTDTAFAEVIQAQLNEIGIRAEVFSQESATVSEDLYARNYDMLIYGYTCTTGEPDRALRRWHKDAGEFEALGWENAEYSDKLNMTSQVTDEAARQQAYGELQQILFDECVSIPWLHKPLFCASGAEMEGFDIMPTLENHRLKYVYFK